MKRFLCGVLAVLLPAALCACGAQETATVRLSEVTHSVFYAPQYVALEQGFFADEGLKIELSNGGGADKVMTAVLTGQADIGLAGPEARMCRFRGSCCAAGPSSAGAQAVCRR